MKLAAWSYELWCGTCEKEPTQINELLPIWVIHMVVYNLPAMWCRHSPYTPGDLIQRSPKCFNCLAIDLLATFNKAGQIPSEAGILVPMDMEKTDAQLELQAVRNLEMPAASHPVLHMNTSLTHYIIANEGSFYAPHIKVQGFEYWIIHVSLTLGASISPGMLIDIGTYTSPFWKSTTESGTKALCMHAVAPIPVDSRWPPCLFTLFTTRWSWQVDLC